MLQNTFDNAGCPTIIGPLGEKKTGKGRNRNSLATNSNKIPNGCQKKTKGADKDFPQNKSRGKDQKAKRRRMSSILTVIVRNTPWGGSMEWFSSHGTDDSLIPDAVANPSKLANNQTHVVLDFTRPPLLIPLSPPPPPRPFFPSPPGSTPWEVPCV